MRLWTTTAGYMTVYRWLSSAARRAQAKRNEDLGGDQRELLQTEGSQLADYATEVKTKGRALDDHQDEVEGALRDEAFVCDLLCDSAQGEAWAVLGMRGAALAQAGTNRASVLGASLTTIKGVGRQRTKGYAASVALSLKQLPVFPERDGLVTKLETRGASLGEVVDQLEEAEDQGETEMRVPLQARMASLRAEMVKLHGRLKAKLPLDVVESIFPRPSRRRRSNPTGGSGGK